MSLVTDGLDNAKQDPSHGSKRVFKVSTPSKSPPECVLNSSLIQSTSNLLKEKKSIISQASLVLTFCSCGTEDRKELPLDAGGQFNQLTTFI